MDNEDKISTGWDKGIDYLKIKEKFLDEIKKLIKKIKKIEEYNYKKHNSIKKIIYLTISIIQLRNGSRITEAINAFKIYSKDNNVDKKVTVKIGKSDSIKTNKHGTQIRLKARYRHIKFPLEWMKKNPIKYIMNTEALNEILNCKNLKRRVCDYLNNNFDCNTHSLRYACINYLLYEEKVDMNAVCKFVGHANNNQLIRYTQMKQVDKIFDMKI